jgi:hypothetical protein
VDPGSVVIVAGRVVTARYTAALRADGWPVDERFVPEPAGYLRHTRLTAGRHR